LHRHERGPSGLGRRTRRRRRNGRLEDGRRLSIERLEVARPRGDRHALDLSSENQRDLRVAGIAKQTPVARLGFGIALRPRADDEARDRAFALLSLRAVETFEEVTLRERDLSAPEMESSAETIVARRGAPARMRLPCEAEHAFDIVVTVDLEPGFAGIEP